MNGRCHLRRIALLVFYSDRKSGVISLGATGIWRAAVIWPGSLMACTYVAQSFSAVKLAIKCKSYLQSSKNIDIKFKKFVYARKHRGLIKCREG
jgi:hypothetical protein